MNNCQKCGNPLGEGITTCPICGTNVVTPSSETKTDATAATPVAAQPVSTTQPNQNIQPSQTTQTVQPQVVSTTSTEPVSPQVVATPTVAVTNQQPAPAPTTVAQPVQPAQAVQPQVTPTTPTEPATVAAQPQVTTPAPTISASSQGVPQPQATTIAPNTTAPTTASPQPTPVAPTVPPTGQVAAQPVVQPIPQPVPKPVAPTPISTPVESVKKEETVKPTKNKKGLKINKNLLLIGVAAIIIIAVMLLALGKKGTAPTTNNQPAQTTNTPTVAQKDTIVGNYKFKLEDGWLVENGTTNIIIKNAKENVIIKLEKYNNNLANITTTQIENNLKEISTRNLSNNTDKNISINDYIISETQIGGKNSFVVNGKITETINEESKIYNVQYYFINCGPEQTLGSTVIYLSEEAKTTYEGSVGTLLGTLSYSDATQKALESVQEHYEAYNLFTQIIRNNTPVTNEIIEENNPTEETE